MLLQKKRRQQKGCHDLRLAFEGRCRLECNRFTTVLKPGCINCQGILIPLGRLNPPSCVVAVEGASVVQ